jgi:hypothetical protein
MSAPRFAPLLLPLLALGACTAPDHPYPSLSPRPIESSGRADAPPVPRPQADVAADPALDAEAAQQRAAAEASIEPFAQAMVEARKAIAAAKGVAPGGEAWVVAQQAISRVDGARGPAANALAALDRMRAEAVKREVPVNTSALDAAWERATAIEEDQRAALGTINGTLPNG